MESIALIGASGSLGKSIAAALKAKGLYYRVLGRSESSLRATFGSDSFATITTWSPDSPESIRESLAGIDTAIYMVGVNYWQFELHPQLMKKTLDGAIAAGAKKLLLIATVYPFGKPQAERVNEDHPRQPHTFKGRMRKEQEDIVLAAHGTEKSRLPSCGCRTSMARASIRAFSGARFRPPRQVSERNSLALSTHLTNSSTSPTRALPSHGSPPSPKHGVMRGI